MKKALNIENNLRRWLLITTGTIFVGLGALGVFLPLLPTTPFLLLAAALYIRSSKRLYNWLITNKGFGTYIKNYREGKGITLTTKIVSIALLWITIGYSVLFVVNILIFQILLILIAVGVTIHLVLVKTLKKED